MASHSFSSSLPILVFSFLFLFPGFPVSHSNPYLYGNCRDAVFECGNISIGYPFSGGNRLGECGHHGLELRCQDGTNTTTIEIHGVKYRVMDIRGENQTLRIGREDYLINDGFCRPQTPIQDSIIDSELFHLVPGYTNVTLFYDCPSLAPSRIFHCNDSDYHNVSVTTDGDGCRVNVTFPISGERFEFHEDDPDLLRSLREALKSGVEVKWKVDTQACHNCNASRGACGFDWYSNQPICICPFGFENFGENPNECPESSFPTPRQPGSEFPSGSDTS